MSIRAALRLVSLLCVGLAFGANADNAPLSTNGKPSKKAIFNVISTEDHQYFDVGPYPKVPISRWGAKLQIMTVGSVSDEKAKAVSRDAMASIIEQVESLHLAQFPGAELNDDDPNPNVLVVVSDDFASLMDKFPRKETPIWKTMFGRARQVMADNPAMTCFRVVGSDNGKAIIAGLIIVSPKSEILKKCAAVALADVLGLRGLADAGESIKTADTGDLLQPLDLEALKMLYGELFTDYRSLSDLVDSYLSR